MKTYYIFLFVALLTCITSNAQVNRITNLQILDNPLVKIDSTGKANETLPMLFMAFAQVADFTGIVSGKLCFASDTMQTADVLEVPFKVAVENNVIQIKNGFFADGVSILPVEEQATHPEQPKYFLNLHFEMTKNLYASWRCARIYLIDTEGNLTKPAVLKR